MAICGAKAKHGGVCKAPPVRGKKRCRMHGGHATGPRTAEGKARCVAANRIGTTAYVKRIMLAKAAGLIDKRPGGPMKGMPIKRKNIMAKALEIIDATTLAPVADNGFARDLEELTGKSIAVIRGVLKRRVAEKVYYRKDPQGGKATRVEPDQKLLQLQVTTAIEVIKLKHRTDEAAFRAQNADRLLPIMEALLAGEKPPPKPS